MSTTHSSQDLSAVTAGVRKRGLQILFQIVLMATILFGAAGRLNWWQAWVYLGLFVGAISVNAFLLLRSNPALVAQRSEVRAGTKGWDRVLANTYVALSSIGTLLVAGLDARFDWTPGVPVLVWVAALELGGLGMAMSMWAMHVNAFFEGTVRIQAERGHRVCSDGPYDWVRHPGYTGWLIYGLALPLVLGSYWALVPAGLAGLLLVVRTRLEDDTLQAELDGYREYASRIRFRLLPGVW